jgi:hypothetical protein
MWMTMKKTLIAFLLLSTLACHRSGTWVDDPENFNRALGIDPPAGVQLVRSWYWRSGHFTREEIYYFQLSAPARYADAFAKENGLVSSGPEAVARFDYTQDRPAWFAPKDPGAYQVWRTPGPVPSGVVLRDRQSGDTFIYCSQL